MRPVKMFDFRDGSIPAHLQDVPGVWANKSGQGYRAPYNVKLLEGVLPGTLPKTNVTLSRVKRLKLYNSNDDPTAYQLQTISRHLVRGRNHLWAPPGAGKTFTGILTAMFLGSPILVVTKAAARSTWEEEIKKRTGFKPVRLPGNTPDTSFKPVPGEFYVTSYLSLLHWHPHLIRCGIKTVLFDEIHWAKKKARRKGIVGRDGKTEWRPLHNISSAASAMASASRYAIGYTATAIPNRTIDLWSQLDIVEPWQWGTSHHFGVRYCEGFKAQYGWQYPGLSNKQELIQRLMYSRFSVSQAEVNARLPKVSRIVTTISYADQCAPAAMKREIKKAARSGNETFLEILLQEAATRKTSVILDRLDECLLAGQKVVVLTNRRKHAEDIYRKARQRIPDRIPLYMAHGGHPESIRDKYRHEYMGSKGPAALIGTGDVWGESINLQDTDRGIIAGLPWTPRKIRQWEGRFPRLGAKRRVVIEYMVAEKTADEKIKDLLLDKFDPVVQVVGDSVVGQISDIFNPDVQPEDLLASLVAGLTVPT